MNVKFWSLKRRFFALLGVAVASGLAVFFVELASNRSLWDATRAAAPFAGSVIALMSLVVTATGLTANWQRQRREATLKAWSEWSDKNRPARRALTKLIGEEVLTAAEGRALVEKSTLPAGRIRDDQTRQSVHKELVQILGGLERLAVGIEQGIFARDTIRAIGGTVVVRQWDRAYEYVMARRTASDALERQKRAYIALEDLCNLLKREKLQDERRDLDRERLRNLRRTPR